jgi:excisionase family DNA binding protein
MSNVDYRDPEWVAERLGIELATVYRLLQAGEIPALQLERHWLIPEVKLLDFLSNQVEWQTEERRKATSSTGAGAGKDPIRTHPPRTRATRRRDTITFTLLGTVREAGSAIDLLTQVVEQLAAKDPSFLERLSQVKGRTRRYVARQKEDLYPGRPDLVQQYSKQLKSGWWLGTNYNSNLIYSIVKKSCQIAGLRWGADLVVGTGTAITDRSKALGFVGIGHDTATDVARRHDEYFVETLGNGRS